MVVLASMLRIRYYHHKFCKPLQSYRAAKVARCAPVECGCRPERSDRVVTPAKAGSAETNMVCGRMVIRRNTIPPLILDRLTPCLTYHQFSSNCTIGVYRYGMILAGQNDSVVTGLARLPFDHTMYVRNARHEALHAASGCSPGTAGTLPGHSSQVRPSSMRPVRFFTGPPHCLKKNGTPARMH